MLVTAAVKYQPPVTRVSPEVTVSAPPSGTGKYSSEIRGKMESLDKTQSVTENEKILLGLLQEAMAKLDEQDEAMLTLGQQISSQDQMIRDREKAVAEQEAIIGRMMYAFKQYRLEILPELPKGHSVRYKLMENGAYEVTLDRPVTSLFAPP